MFTTSIAEKRMDDESIFVKVIGGTPQGGVISSLLWRLVVNELLQRLKKLDFKCVGYADYIVLNIGCKYLRLKVEGPQKYWTVVLASGAEQQTNQNHSNFVYTEGEIIRHEDVIICR